MGCKTERYFLLGYLAIDVDRGSQRIVGELLRAVVPSRGVEIVAETGVKGFLGRRVGVMVDFGTDVAWNFYWQLQINSNPLRYITLIGKSYRSIPSDREKDRRPIKLPVGPMIFPLRQIRRNEHTKSAVRSSHALIRLGRKLRIPSKNLMNARRS